MRKKFTCRQLVAKIANFADISQNNCIFTQKKKKKKRYLKLSIARKAEFYRISTKWLRIYAKNRAFKVNQLQENFTTINLEFCQFLAKE